MEKDCVCLGMEHEAFKLFWGWSYGSHVEIFLKGA
jgi:hypothetical protein